MIKNSYFILSSTCKLVNGAKRNVIIDYMRDYLYFISHDYFELILKMDRCKLEDVEKELDDDESKVFFEEFLAFIKKYEIGFFTESPENFPRIRDEYHENEYISLLDVIIEVDERFYNRSQFEKLCKELRQTKCKDFQIRLLSDFNLELLDEVVEMINTTCANYLEIHCTQSEDLDINALKDFVARQPVIAHIYIYGAQPVKPVNVMNYNSDYYPTSLGMIYFLDYPFDDGNCCGIINQKSFIFAGLPSHNRLKVRNGCLDRKLAIDRFGNIKNCPSMKKTYGNIETTSLSAIIKTDAFRSPGLITKDQISICKVCEFRYNCSDCRAFITDPDDIYSKPFKCAYDPFTCTWQEDSQEHSIEKMTYQISTT